MILLLVSSSLPTEFLIVSINFLVEILKQLVETHRTHREEPHGVSISPHRSVALTAASNLGVGDMGFSRAATVLAHCLALAMTSWRRKEGWGNARCFGAPKS